MSVPTATLLKDEAKGFDVVYDGMVLVYSLWWMVYMVMELVAPGEPIMILYLPKTTFIASCLEYAASFYFIYRGGIITDFIQTLKIKENMYYAPKKTLGVMGFALAMAHLFPLCYAIIFRGLPNGFPAFSTACILLGLNLANSYSLQFKKKIKYCPYETGSEGGYTHARFASLFIEKRFWLPTFMFITSGLRIALAIISITPVMKGHHPTINYLYMMVSPAYACCFVFFGSFLLQTSLLQVSSLEK